MSFRGMNLRQMLYIRQLQKKDTWLNEHEIPGGRIRRNKTVYIIRRSGKKLGLFSYVVTCLPRIIYALENDMIPVVDMCNYDNSLKKTLADNPWDDYFVQPGGLSLEEAYKSKSIIISDAGIPDNRPCDDTEFLSGKNGELDYWRERFAENIKIREEVKKRADLRFSELGLEGERVLGVLARGTDYLSLKPSGHPVQPQADQIIEKVIKEIERQHFTKVFLATEDAMIADLFRSQIGEKCVINDKAYIDYKGDYLAYEGNQKQINDNDKNLDYVINMIILSRCDGIIAGRTSGTVGAALMSENWEYSHFFDLGTYE
ncbi:MAG: hypothetical protein IKQ44_05095 [Lachnospiraceae bacterium]|nr:hypothetical protein [Lachnospiraceae bacterium]